MPDFSIRSSEAEMMDDFTLGHQVIDPIMQELAVVNNLLGGYRVFFNAFKKVGLHDGITISDWGCGGGDSLRVIARWARKRKIRINLVGVDATGSAIEYARERSKRFPEISYIHSDVMNPDLQFNQFDIVISSLFTHHFPEADWIRLMQKMAYCARRHVIINDLHRHWFAYHSIAVLTAIFSKSEMVKHDSKLSVLRSFKRPDLDNMLQKAGFRDYSIKWMWAFRWQVCLKINSKDQTGLVR
jgi:2-polyprenyl-3-methyl-5-hydroxy-6-metoxy-1,4-benzoquinol methylase